jgi:hypothetical protein
MINGINGAYPLTTFLGPDDIRLMSREDFSRNILGVTLQDGPLNLLCPDFNLTSEKTDSTMIEAAISILDHLFIQLCPGYSKEPHGALDHIQQTYNNATGNTIFSPVFDYCTQILAASCPFINLEDTGFGGLNRGGQ